MLTENWSIGCGPMAVKISDDVVLIVAIQDFMNQFRSVVAYPDLVGMNQSEFECQDPTDSAGDYWKSLSGSTWKCGLTGGFAPSPARTAWTSASAMESRRASVFEVDLVPTNGATLYGFEAIHCYCSASRLAIESRTQ